MNLQLFLFFIDFLSNYIINFYLNNTFIIEKQFKFKNLNINLITLINFITFISTIFYIIYCIK